jgi:hypothetical protein
LQCWRSCSLCSCHHRPPCATASSRSSTDLLTSSSCRFSPLLLLPAATSASASPPPPSDRPEACSGVQTSSGLRVAHAGMHWVYVREQSSCFPRGCKEHGTRNVGATQLGRQRLCRALLAKTRRQSIAINRTYQLHTALSVCATAGMVQMPTCSAEACSARSACCSVTPAAAASAAVLGLLPCCCWCWVASRCSFLRSCSRWLGSDTAPAWYCSGGVVVRQYREQAVQHCSKTSSKLVSS